MLNDKSRTVKLVILNEHDRILLTHELEEKNGKHEGSSLPGGGVEPERTHEFVGIIEVESLAKDSNIGPANLAIVQSTDCRSAGIDLDIFIAAIQEGLTETGFLVLPQSLLFIDPVADDHEVWVLAAKVIAGKLKIESLETDNCGWYPIDRLPIDLYHKDHYRIVRGLEIMGRKDLAMKLNFEGNQKEEHANVDITKAFA